MISIDRTRRISKSLARLPAPIAFLASVLAGFVLLLASVIIGVGFCEYTNAAGAIKQVGFVPAPNWSVGSFVLIPCISFFALLSYQNLDRVLDDLIERGMLRRPSMSTPRRKAAETAWYGTLRYVLLAGVVILVIMLAWSIGEFWIVSGTHLMSGQPPPITEDPVQEIDWSVISVVNPGTVSRGWNFFFSLTAYLAVVGLGVSLGFVYFALLSGLAWFLYSTAVVESQLILIPDLKSNDRRRGYQVLEPFFESAMIVTGLVFLLLYFIHVQNMYLRSDASTIWAFLRPKLPDSSIGDLSSATKVDGLVGYALSSETAPNLSSALAALLGCFAFCVVIGVVVFCLRHAALEGGNRLRAQFEEGDTSAFPTLSREECVARLDSMSYWPLRWPRINQLLVLLLLGLLSLIFYKMGMVTFVIMVTWVVTSVTHLKRGGKSSSSR